MSTVCQHADTCAWYALRWTTEAELTGPRTDPPSDMPTPPRWAAPSPRNVGPLWLVERDDPNAGLPPLHAAVTEVRDRFQRFASEHLGGTLMRPDGPDRAEMSAYYLELNRAGGFSFAGDDDLAIDLDAEMFLPAR